MKKWEPGGKKNYGSTRGVGKLGKRGVAKKAGQRNQRDVGKLAPRERAARGDDRKLRDVGRLSPKERAVREDPGLRNVRGGPRAGMGSSQSEAWMGLAPPSHLGLAPPCTAAPLRAG